MVAIWNLNDAMIWSALTADGGTTWSTRPHNHEGLSPAIQQRYAGFDPTVGFGPEGNAYVLFGGGVGICFADCRITLERSVDQGKTWTEHTVDSSPAGEHWHDYMSLAVAPDTGTLYVVSDVYVAPVATGFADLFVRYTALWRSDDRGSTWQGPTLVHAALSFHNGELHGEYYPRIVAAAGGVVVVGAEPLETGPSRTYAGRGATVIVSRDEGRTFGAPVLVTGGAKTGLQISVWNAPDGSSTIDAVTSTLTDVTLIRSIDGGKTWREPLRIATIPPGEAIHQVQAATHATDGTVYALQRFSTNQRYGIALLRLAPGSTSADRMVLSEAPTADRKPMLGGDYEGLDVGADGTVWVAWTEADADRGLPSVAVARLSPPGP
ncbi:MAG: exo-alpha-sialidase [Euryarchaeota archaeon]|nr:exo-alpha-sialidase [Euryarchaeota archaeon]